MRWEVRTAEGTVGERIKILDAGYWKPTGSSLKDVLFPHATCGFRSRVLNVAAIEVITYDLETQIFMSVCSIPRG